MDKGVGTGFRSNEDVYQADTSGWSTPDWYMCYRWLSRVVVKAPRKPWYRAELLSLDPGRLNAPARAMLKVLLAEVPAARDLLPDESLAAIESQPPLDPPLALSDNPFRPAAYERMGLLL